MSSSPALIALQSLADRCAARVHSGQVTDPLDLSGRDGLELFGTEDAAWVDALERAQPAKPEDVVAALRAAAGIPATVQITCFGSANAALEAVLDAARTATGRSEVTHIDALAGASPSDATAVLIADARVDGPTLAQQRARAARARCWLLADAHRTAGRLQGDLVPALGEIGQDCCVVLGQTWTGGHAEFAIVLSSSALDTPEPPTPFACAVVLATLERLAVGDVAPRLAQLGDALRTRFDAACRRENIHAALEGPAAWMKFSFAGQENAEAPLMAQHFGIELERTGARAQSPDVFVHLGLEDSDAFEALATCVDRAVARMRCLLIEHNSYLCGEVPYPFPDADPVVADRGLAYYRFPKLGPVELRSEPDQQLMRIRFVGGELGEVTSSGFYLPTLFTGDFDVSARYRVLQWEPGPDSACVALFAQNLASSARYYAQRMSSGNAPDAHTVLGSLATVLSGARPVEAPEGAFRIVRRAGALTAWHRAPDDDDWQLLATDADATRDDVVFGLKIWSKVESGVLEVTVHDLVIEGTLAEEQIPRLEHRPDPRSA